MKQFECMECGKRFSTAQANKAIYGDGCPNCGGSDIDLGELRRDVESRTSATLQQMAHQQRLNTHYHKDLSGNYSPR